MRVRETKRNKRINENEEENKKRKIENKQNEVFL